MRYSIRTAALAGVSAIAFGAVGATAQTLTIGVGSPVTSLDPHYHQLSPNNAVSDMIFEKLIDTDAAARNIPGLATEWRAVGPTVWEFKLRPGVRFHTGNPFTAEDVAFTIQRLPNAPNSPPMPPTQGRSCGWRSSIRSPSASTPHRPIRYCRST